jgi:hypothetical protein
MPATCSFILPLREGESRRRRQGSVTRHPELELSNTPLHPWLSSSAAPLASTYSRGSTLIIVPSRLFPTQNVGLIIVHFPLPWYIGDPTGQEQIYSRPSSPIVGTRFSRSFSFSRQA